MTDKFYLSKYTLERIRERALEKGTSEEAFDRWAEDCVIIVEPI